MFSTWVNSAVRGTPLSGMGLQEIGLWFRHKYHANPRYFRIGFGSLILSLTACFAVYFAKERSIDDGPFLIIAIGFACGILAPFVATFGNRATRHTSILSARAVNALEQENEEHRVFFDSSKNLIFVTDRNGQILRVTPSVVQILGFAAEDLIDLCVADYVTPDERVRVRDEMRLANSNVATRAFEANLIHKNGHHVALSWSCTWSETAHRYFFIGRDRTEANKQQDVIAAQNVKLDLALTNMSQGLLLFDSTGGVSLVNSQFIAMFGLDPGNILSIKSASDLLQAVIATGLVEKTSQLAGYLRAIARQDFDLDVSDHQELLNGQTISIKVSRLTEGGILATLENITQLQSALRTLAINNSILEKREAELRTKHLQLDAAINNMNHGLTLLDSQGCVILANDQSLEMYGLTRRDDISGMTIADILALRISKGIGTKEFSDKGLSVFTDRLKYSDDTPFVVEMKTGNLLSISCRPMASGGWVITHRDVSEEHRKEAKITHMARHDILTDLPNRVVLAEALEQALAHCRRGKCAALHFLDLDYFKTVNDTLGHSIGDKLLLAVSERLRSCVRKSDTVVRLGGDEFAILQTFIERPEDATGLARRLIDAVRAPYEIDGRPINIGMSIGIALAPGDGVTPESLLKNSDLALYRAKELGRGDYHFFEAALDVKMQKRRDLEDELRKAVKNGQFELHYQPFVSTETRRIHGAEALLRWRHPERGMISPLDFIPIAEEIGLIIPIGDWVIREACAAAATWPSHVRIAINLSPVQFRRPDIVQTIVGALAAAQLDASRLEIEVTESLLLEASDSVLSILYQLRELGVGIALDDFGTGYSSLSYLQRFPFTRIKIDRSFVKNLGVQESAAELIRAIVAIAKAVNMKITAEGIETDQQLKLAVAAGCTEFQGYLFSRPRAASEIAAVLCEKIDALQEAA